MGRPPLPPAQTSPSPPLPPPMLSYPRVIFWCWSKCNCNVAVCLSLDFVKPTINQSTWIQCKHQHLCNHLIQIKRGISLINWLPDWYQDQISQTAASTYSSMLRLMQTTLFGFRVLLFNSRQQSTNNNQNEYKYLTVFVLQKTSFTGFSQTSLRLLVLRKR